MRSPASALRLSKKLFILFLFTTFIWVSFGHVIYSSNQTTEVFSSNIKNDSEQQLTLPNVQDPDNTTQIRRNKIRQMTLHAWNNYKQYAWGKNELRPVTKGSHRGPFGNADIGTTIIDSLDTLYIMGLKEEYQQGRKWVEEKFSFQNLNADLSVFETNIRYVGGLLSMYAITGEELYKTKAQEVADKLLPAFQTPTGIPHAIVNTRTGRSKNYGWASGSILSEIGSLHLEFSYLTDITGNSVYRNHVVGVRDKLRDTSKPNGLYPNYIDPVTGRWGQKHVSLGALGDSFYEYLLKVWIQSNRTDSTARQMYDNAMSAIVDNIIVTSPSGLIYASDMKFGELDHKMQHLTCFAGGLFALGSATQIDQNTEKYMNIGVGITSTCHESYMSTATQIGPETFRFNNQGPETIGRDDYYILRPEVFESYFVLWRLTHDQKYRDWGWQAVLAIERSCRTENGYSGIQHVNSRFPRYDDVQQSFFLAESLKYLYLLFSDDSLLPLDEWVFNTEAHPLPIKGTPWYRTANGS